MLAKPIAILASAAIVTEVVAAHARRHAHQHVHDKRGAHFVEDVAHLDVVVETVTDWVVVTVTEGDEPTSSARDSPIIFVENTHTYPHTSSTSSTSTSTSTSTSSTTSTTPPPAPPPTTLTTSVAPTKAAAIALSASVAVDTPAAAAAAPAATTPASSGSKKRGLAYNDASLLPPFVGDGSKVDWAYNWGQTSSGMTIDVEYVPMLWSNGANFAPTWNANAAAAIAAGSGHLLSFNEPDNPGQADMSPAEAASAHIQYMNPFAGKAAIGAPAITNSGSEGQGLSWLTQFLGACAGQCHIDFYPIHWYSPCDSGAFLSYLLEVYQTVKADIWITEFAPTTGDDSDISQFLQEVMSQMDGNSTFSFVQRYSYFMVEDGSLISSGTTLSSIGSTFAYS